MGDNVLTLAPGGNLPHGKWIAEVITKFPEERSILVSNGRMKKAIALGELSSSPKVILGARRCAMNIEL